MHPPSISPCRGGFLLLMLIAFTSIILGLSVTFYMYCKRGLDDSQIAVRIAQQRLALASAMGQIYASSYSGLPPITWREMEYSDLSHTTNLGWYRIAKATNAYVTAHPLVFGACNPLYTFVVTAGTGPSRGDPSTTISDDRWRYELRTWYAVGLGADAGITMEHVFPILPKPADGEW